MKIVEVPYGIANRFTDGTIEVNKNLKKYPEVYKAILKHELEHTDDFFTLHDLKHDLNSEHEVDQFQMLKFILRHPLTLVQFLPIFYTKKRGIYYDLNLIIFYSFMIIIAVIAFLIL